MPDYKDLYLKLFRASEKAIKILIAAQQECEELFINQPEPELKLVPLLSEKNSKMIKNINHSRHISGILLAERGALMDYYLEILRSVNFIEQHLTEELSLRDIAAEANLSVPHLYRVFPALAGCTVGQYIRRRRLTEAAQLLRQQNRVLDVALEYQFESQESFTRAFKSLFGLTPGEYKRNPVLIPDHRPIQIRQNEKGEQIMQPEIIVKQFILLGMETGVDLSADFAGQITLLTDAVRQRLAEVREPVRPVHIVNMWYPKFQSDLPMSEPTTMFFTGVEVAPGTISLEGMAIKALPESLYAVFEEHQRGVIGGPNGAAYRMWLPNSGYVLNDAIPGDLEDYPDVEHVGYHDVCKIWIPICSR